MRSGRVALVTAALFLCLPAVAIDQREQSRRASEAVLREQLFRMRDAIGQHCQQRGACPESLEQLVSRGYLRQIPRDPTTGSQAWQVIRIGGTIVDVKSTSNATAMDGRAYSQWN